MDIEITEANFDDPLILAKEEGIRLISRAGEGSFSCSKGNSYECWVNQYRFKDKTILNARGDIPVLKLHIARKGIWSGEWDGINELAVKPWHFNLTYTPHVKTSAVFRPRSVYESYDLHFDFNYLATLTRDFAVLDQFLLLATKKSPVSISDRQHACTREMMQLVNEAFLFSGRLKQAQIRQLLIDALEKVSLDIQRPLTLFTKRDKDALLHARHLIECWDDQPLDLRTVALLTGLNEYILKTGFSALFGVSPYAYHVQQKMMMAKQLLLDTQLSVTTIAYQLGYSQSASLAREFRKAYGMNPIAFRKKL